MDDVPVGRTSTAGYGLALVKVPGGLYSVKNLAGGVPPNKFRGTFTSGGDLEAAIAVHNKKDK